MDNTQQGVTVIGGANIDLAARHHHVTYHEADSSQGEVSISAGGVGRNIAETLGRMGSMVQLITAFGDDDFAQIIRSSLDHPHINYTASLTQISARSDCYLSVMDHHGELIQAINQMALVDKLTPTYLEGIDPYIQGASRLIADCNLPQNSLGWLALHDNRPALYVDGVSSEKIIKLRDMLDRIDGLKCNQLEARTLLNMPEDTSAEDVLTGLTDAGVTTVLLSLGEDGLMASSHGQVIHMPALSTPDDIMSVSGAGDALFAGFIFGELAALNLNDALELGMDAARLTLTCTGAVHPDIATILTPHLSKGSH